jgi:hypothetical protein
MALYSVRSERLFCEQLDYNLLFRWFLDIRPLLRETRLWAGVGLALVPPVFDLTTYLAGWPPLP